MTQVQPSASSILSIWADAAASLFLLAGAFFCLTAAIGIVRFPDTLTRLHAATKPQVFGLLLVLTGIALSLRSWQAVLICVLVAAFQIATNPVSAHMVSRAAYRTGLWAHEDAVMDDLAADLQRAGFTRPQASVDDELAAQEQVKDSVAAPLHSRPSTDHEAPHLS